MKENANEKFEKMKLEKGGNFHGRLVFLVQVVKAEKRKTWIDVNDYQSNWKVFDTLDNCRQVVRMKLDLKGWWDSSPTEEEKERQKQMMPKSCPPLQNYRIPKLLTAPPPQPIQPVLIPPPPSQPIELAVASPSPQLIKSAQAPSKERNAKRRKLRKFKRAMKEAEGQWTPLKPK